MAVIKITFSHVFILGITKKCSLSSTCAKIGVNIASMGLKSGRLSPYIKAYSGFTNRCGEEWGIMHSDLSNVRDLPKMLAPSPGQRPLVPDP